MKSRIKLLLAGLLLVGSVNAQVTNGTIKGQVMDDETSTSIPLAKVWLEGDGNINTLRADVDGKFTFEALKPGLYNLYAISSGKDTTVIKAIEVKPESITDLGGVELFMSNGMLGVVPVIYTPKLIDKDVQKIMITTEDIKHSPNIRNPKALFASMNSDIQIKEGTNEMIIRGSRPGDVVYFVDGVKTNDLNGVPGVGIGSMMGYTGGVPAKYGDTTGGVVILETKSYFDLYYAWKAKQ
jgi:hypothetical protein